MRIVPLTLFFFTMALAMSAQSGKIYQWKDQNGNIVFGDRPVDKQTADEVEVLPMMVVPAYETPEQRLKRLEEEAEKAKLAALEAEKNAAATEEVEEEEEEFKYTSFKVTSPADGEAIRANSGNVSVGFSLEPALGPNDTISVYVDGKKHKENSKNLMADLINLNRGEHSVFAVVKNEAGSVLLNSDTIRFTVLRHSALFKKQ